MNTDPTKGRFFSNKGGNWTVWDEIHRGKIWYSILRYTLKRPKSYIQPLLVTRLLDSARAIQGPRNIRRAPIESLFREWLVAKWERRLCPLSSSPASLRGSSISATTSPVHQSTDVSQGLMNHWKLELMSKAVLSEEEIEHMGHCIEFIRHVYLRSFKLLEWY